MMVYTRVVTGDTKTAEKERDVLSRLADRGEEVLGKLADVPGGAKAVQAVNGLRSRVDDLSRKVRGVDELEARVAHLEKDVAALRRAAKKPANS
jgi:uncharacterized small protein (DUF1192 family)